VDVHGAQTLSSVMHQLKGASSRWVTLTYPEIKLDMENRSFWQKGYGWRRLTAAEVPTVRRYIRTQEQRPLRHGEEHV